MANFDDHGSRGGLSQASVKGTVKWFNATKIADVHLHLHHSLNCLVGPGGNGFDAKEMNPCAHAGNGAIPDLGPDSAKFAALNTAAAKARDGIAETDLKKAQADAAIVRSMLNKAQ